MPKGKYDVMYHTSREQYDIKGFEKGMNKMICFHVPFQNKVFLYIERIPGLDISIFITT